MLKYHIIKRPNMQEPTGPPLYYPSLVLNGALSQRQLANRIAKMTSLTTTDVMSMLEALFDLLPDYLEEGYIVRLGDLGSFRATIQTHGSATEDEVSEENIDRLNARFIPGPLLRKKLAAIAIRRVEK